MTFLLKPQSWGKIVPSVADGTQPVANQGTTVTPAQNAYGTYAQVLAGAQLALFTEDAFGIWININSGSVSAQARDMLCTIGIDPAGGSSAGAVTDLINGLACPMSSPWVTDRDAGGISYFFPLRIKAGSSIWAKVAVNNASVFTVRVQIRLFCKPKQPHLVKAGAFVTTFGAAVGTSNGTAVVPGQASEGTWTQLGSALTKPHWFWQLGFGINQAVADNAAFACDLGIGDGTNNRVAILEDTAFTTTVERCRVDHVGGYLDASIGDKVYGRIQASALTATNTQSMIAYGVGG
jgi:hypothetical protein